MPDTFTDAETGERFEAAQPPKRLYQHRRSTGPWERRVEALRRAVPPGRWVIFWELGSEDSASTTLARMERMLRLSEGLELALDGKRILARAKPRKSGSRAGGAPGPEHLTVSRRSPFT